MEPISIVLRDAPLDAPNVFSYPLGCGCAGQNLDVADYRHQRDEMRDTHTEANWCMERIVPTPKLFEVVERSVVNTFVPSSQEVAYTLSLLVRNFDSAVHRGRPCESLVRTSALVMVRGTRRYCINYSSRRNNFWRVSSCPRVHSRNSARVSLDYSSRTGLPASSTSISKVVSSILKTGLKNTFRLLVGFS